MTTQPNTSEQKPVTFSSRDYGTVTVIMSTYRNNGRLAVALVDANGETLTMLSANLPYGAHLLSENEFFAKTWSENASIAAEALASGVFQDTGRTSGEVLNARIWRLA